MSNMKKETIEEAADRLHQEGLQNDLDLSFHDGVKFGAEWQAERMYSEEEVAKLLISCKERFGGSDLDDYIEDSKVIKWFEQFKKQ